MGEVLSIEQVLAAEADEIHGGNLRAQLESRLRDQEAQKKLRDQKPPEKLQDQQSPEKLQDQKPREERAWLNADDRDGTRLPDGEKERREELYRALNKLNRAALCFSGGGIRSATFCLGVLRALADYDVTRHAPKSHHAAPTGPGSHASTSAPSSGESAEAAPPKAKTKPEIKPEIKPENSLLGCFDYLSTVSGGGYIGSWLSSWRTREDFPAVIRSLTSRPDGADVEPPEISWLRAYSNYLTPRIGIASADSWAAVAICVRNLILNWLIIIPVVCLVLLTLKTIAAGGVRVAYYGIDSLPMFVILMLGVACLIFAQSFTNRYRPSRRTEQDSVNEASFLWLNFLWAFISAILLTIFFASYYFSSFVNRLGFDPKIELLLLMAGAGFLIYLIGWIAGRRLGRAWPDFMYWAVSGLVYGALVGVGAYLYHWFAPYRNWPFQEQNEWYLLIPIIFGVPWVLMSQLTADNIFVGLASYEPISDSDREWLGRAAGWLAAGAIAWALTAFLVFAGGYFIQTATGWTEKIVVPLGGVTGILSGIVTAFLGSSSKTAANAISGKHGGKIGKIYNIVLAVTGPLFAATLIIALSIALDKVLLGSSLIDKLKSAVDANSIDCILVWLLIGFAIALVIGGIASSRVNINRFSLHALYRNRLIRAYLGASRQERHPDRFTGFDADDNIRMHELWPPKSGGGFGSKSLFHVVNIALNVVATKRKAWQQRKAEPFTVSPLHCGSSYLGFRESDEYGDSLHTHQSGKGITLGTAMAISGAAVSPNMGYHSSPSVELLLTFFNVRLGWWLGNPGPAGDKHGAYRREGPRFAALPLLFEAFGQTTDDRPYVYLSDGGHFEDLGLYEMVRRRCRFIIVVDAGCDPKFGFEDLGNAVRKIYIDLGVAIDFEGLDRLQNRPSAEVIQRESAKGPIPYCAIGTIDYKNADGSECENGFIIYIKPAYHDANEGAGIRSYAIANPTFPHESTADQWFTESQFESYRSLGMEIANDVLDDQAVRWCLHRFLGALGNPTPT
jgi:hypothetical protein